MRQSVATNLYVEFWLPWQPNCKKVEETNWVSIDEGVSIVNMNTDKHTVTWDRRRTPVTNCKDTLSSLNTGLWICLRSNNTTIDVMKGNQRAGKVSVPPPLN